MPDIKSSFDDVKRIEQELSEQVSPWYIVALAAFLKVFFFVYDAIVFIPFKIFADPEKKLERSQRDKGGLTNPKDPSSPWRNVDTLNKPLWNQLFPGCDNLGKLWDKALELHSNFYCMGARVVHEVSEERQENGRTFQKLVLGEYEWKKYYEVNNDINAIIQSFHLLGINKGQHIVIYAETRMEWMITAISCFKSGFIVVTIYPTLGADAITYALNECDAVAIVTTRNLLKTVASVINDCPTIKNIIYFSELHSFPETNVTTFECQSITNTERKLISFETLLSMGLGSTAPQTTIEGNDLAMIMYTSGTTGNPKGVLLSHRNIISALTGQNSVVSVGKGDSYIGYLPLAHILEVCAELIVLYKGCRIGYSSAQTLFDRAPKIKKGSKGDCAELKPTLIACVPAIMDRIFKAVSDEIKEKSAFQRELFRICYERKRARYEEGYTSLVMNRLAFDRIRKLLGGELRIILSGGAPLNPETQRFMNICFCCSLIQGYGLTETCGAATLSDEHDLSTGSVGPPLRCCEILLREWSEAGYSPTNETPQGEILIHGDNVALGYFKNEQKTNEDFIYLNGKRWFATGDIGEFRADGSLMIIDRKKDLIKLSHGEYISLGKVETSLLRNPLVDNICVYGNSHRDYLIALVVPNQKNFTEMADKAGFKEQNFEQLCLNQEVRKLLAKELGDYVFGKLSRSEIPRKVFICSEPWTSISGLLTEALKLKRKNIEKAYERELHEMYNDTKR